MDALLRELFHMVKSSLMAKVICDQNLERNSAEYPLLNKV